MKFSLRVLVFFFRAPRAKIDSRILVRRILDVWHYESVHHTAFALTENTRLGQRVRSSPLGPRLEVDGYPLIRLPNVPDVANIVVNDAREIFVERIYETAGVRLKPQDIVIDCGANIGLFSIYAAGRIGSSNGQPGQILAFEPVPSLFETLRSNLAIGREKTRGLETHGICAAASDYTGRAQISVHASCFTMNSMAETRREGSSIGIECLTIDDLVQQRALPRVDFIKMDIEGFEAQALRGARQTIRKWRPRLALAAYHFPTDLVELPKLVRELNPDYRVLVTRKSGPMLYAW